MVQPRYDGLAQVKGSQPRWLGLPRAVQDESHTGAKMQVWPPAVPPPDPPGLHDVWMTVLLNLGDAVVLFH